MVRDLYRVTCITGWDRRRILEDKTEELLSQYELSILTTRKTRGGLLLETPKGPYLLCRTEYGEGRLFRENTIKKALEAKGYPHLDVFLENREGRLLTSNMYGESFLVKRWFHGEECSLRSRMDIRRAAGHLGYLHGLLDGLWKEVEQVKKDDEENDGTGITKWREQEGLPESFVRKNRELTHIFRYITNKKKRNAFELRYLTVYEAFYEDCCEALSLVQKSACRELSKKAADAGRMFHGSYNQHKVLFSQDTVFTMDFSKSEVGLPVMDVYHFLRKTMEKNNWNPALARELLLAYQKQRMLCDEELELLKILLLYPEKFWKVANYYNNTRKTWLSERTLKKLEDAIVQLPKRKRFLRELS